MTEINALNIINMTPHDVTYVADDGGMIGFKASGYKIRLREDVLTIGFLDGFKLTHSYYGDPILVCPDGSEDTLPAERKNTYYIVSQLCQQALKDRKDLLIPNELVRDESGRIIGCHSFGAQAY